MDPLEFYPDHTRRRSIENTVWWADKLTCLLYSSLSLEEFANAMRAAEFEAAIENAPTGVSRREAFANIPLDAKILNSIFSHEQDHLRRQFSTTSGLIQLHLASRILALTQKLILDHGTTNYNRLFPLLKLPCGDILRNFTNLTPETADVWALYLDASSVEHSVLHVITTHSLMHALEGNWHGSTKQRTLAFAEAALVWLTHEHGVEYEPSAMEALSNEAFWPHTWLGAKHLFELSAVTYEIGYLSGLGSDATPWMRTITTEPDYNLAMQAWFNLYPKDEYSREGAFRDTDLLSDTYRIYPVEHFAALDLALWIPWFPDGFRGCDNALRWEDLQPGWRFHRALATLSETGNALTPITSANRERIFHETQRAICNANGWPTPDELASVWLAHLESGDWHSNSTFFGHLNEPGIEIATQVLRLRHERAFDTVTNNLDWGDIEARFKCWMTREVEDGNKVNVIRLVSGDAGADRVRNSYYLLNGCTTLLYGPSGTGMDALCRSQKEEAIACMDDYLRCDGWNSEVFRAQAGMVFRLV